MNNYHMTSISSGVHKILSTFISKRGVLLVILAVVILSLTLRLYGLNWDRGFSYTPHPDERAILMKVDEISLPALNDLIQLVDAEESSWNPRWFPYGSLPLYLLKIVQNVYSLGPNNGLHDLRFTGRLISALADLTTVAMIFILGNRFYGLRVGLLASALASVTVIHIQLSHFLTSDVLLTTFTIISIYFIIKVAREGRLRDSNLAGVFMGLCLATKISLAPIFAVFIMAHLIHIVSKYKTPNSDSIKHLYRSTTIQILISTFISIVVLFIVQPYAFLDWNRFLGDVVEQSEMVRRIRDYPYTRQYIDTTPYFYHVLQLSTWGLGWPLGIITWLGLVYTSLRGMRLIHGFMYIGIGWGIPISIMLISTNLMAILIASSIAFITLALTLLVRDRTSWTNVLLLSWLIPYFLIVGAFEVKFIRYLLPMTPFMLILGSNMLFDLWDYSKTHIPNLRPWLISGLVLLIFSTGFYAISYVSIYKNSHTAVRASEWINKFAPKGSTILKEHWDEGLPNLHGYQTKELPMYNNDTSQKITHLADELSRGDYLVLFSNRLYGTLPRLPDRYPRSTEYYKLLFSGQLGYELVNFQFSYPQLWGIGFIDDTFLRHDVPKPAMLEHLQPYSISLQLGYADESFTVYDHPKVMIFQNVRRYDSDNIKRFIEGSVTDNLGNRIGLMLSPKDTELQQRGGTWHEIISEDSPANRFPVAIWLIVIQGIALLAIPITLFLFRPLSDRGYLLAKPLGLAIVCLIVWLMASFQWLTFSRFSIILAVSIMALSSVLIFIFTRRDLITFIKHKWRIMLIGETLFLIAFFAFLLIRMANPDLWHPYRGGEKPMDFAYLNAILRSSYMPPYDPWFGGGYLNYYYWGHFIIATLIKVSKINPTVAYNMAIPLMFAFTITGSFTIVYNMASWTRKKLETSRSMISVHRFNIREPWSPIIAGIVGALFLTVLGNLGGAIQLTRSIWHTIFSGISLGTFDFYASTRMMPKESEGITEFPFFTFLFGDLHAHLLSLPYTLLVLSIAITIIMAKTTNKTLASNTIHEVFLLATMGITIGALRLINAWDFPTYLLVGVLTIFIAEYFSHGGLGIIVLTKWMLKSLFIFIVGYLSFMPFHLHYEVFFTSLDLTTHTTDLWRFLAIYGLFIFIIGSFMIQNSRNTLTTLLHKLPYAFRSIPSSIQNHQLHTLMQRLNPLKLIKYYILAISLVGLIIISVLHESMGTTIPFAVILLGITYVVGIKSFHRYVPDAPIFTFAIMVVSVAIVLVIGLDIFRVEGDVDRMNSIFKFYLQIWVFLSLISAYILWRLAYGKQIPITNLSLGRKMWLGGLTILIIGASIYPLLGTHTRLETRFSNNVKSMTLDGAAFIENSIYRDPAGVNIDLASDYEAIQWLNHNVTGSPIILEGVTPPYRWGSRISVYTGLPTIIGWQWHQKQQRWDYQPYVNKRIKDVETFYLTTNPSEALKLIKEYNVEFIIAGQIERAYYPGAGWDKFENNLSGNLTRVFQNDQVSIYQGLSKSHK